MLTPLPDILCYQEIPDTYANNISIIPPGYRSVYAPAWMKKGIMYGQLTAYNPNTVSFQLNRIVNLGTSIWERKLFRQTGERTGLLTLFESGGHLFNIINIHLVCLARNKTRRNQLNQIIESLNDHTTPTIIVGDYNYSNILQWRRLRSYMMKRGFIQAGSSHNTHRLLFLNHQLDYAFHRNCEIHSVTVGERVYSDHAPLFVHFDHITPPAIV